MGVRGGGVSIRSDKLRVSKTPEPHHPRPNRHCPEGGAELWAYLFSRVMANPESYS